MVHFIVSRVHMLECHFVGCKTSLHVVEILRNMPLPSRRWEKVVGKSTAGSKANGGASVNLVWLTYKLNLVFSTQEGKCN